MTDIDANIQANHGVVEGSITDRFMAVYVQYPVHPFLTLRILPFIVIVIVGLILIFIMLFVSTIDLTTLRH